MFLSKDFFCRKMKHLMGPPSGALCFPPSASQFVGVSRPLAILYSAFLPRQLVTVWSCSGVVPDLNLLTSCITCKSNFVVLQCKVEHNMYSANKKM
jgi:hypothetical protein